MSPELRELVRWAVDFKRRMQIEQSGLRRCPGCGATDPEATTIGCKACSNRNALREGRRTHGRTATYRNAGCRCRACCAAQRNAERLRLRRKRLAVASRPPRP